MAAPALVVHEEAVLHAALDGLLGGLHHLCEQKDRQEVSFIMRNVGPFRDLETLSVLFFSCRRTGMS